MEGRIALFETDKEGKKPHFKGYITIAGEEHEFAVWPAKSGKGYSGNYKLKQQRQVDAPPLPQDHQASPLDDDEIQF